MNFNRNCLLFLNKCRLKTKDFNVEKIGYGDRAISLILLYISSGNIARIFRRYNDAGTIRWQKGKKANLKTGVSRKPITPNFPKNEHFLPPTYRRFKTFGNIIVANQISLQKLRALLWIITVNTQYSWISFHGLP